METLTDRLTTLLDQQFQHTLEEAEQQELESLLSTVEGKQFHAEYLAMRQGLVSAGRDSMKSTIQTWEGELENSHPEAKIQRFPVWGRLVAVAAAVMMMVLIFRPGDTDSRNSLMQELSQPYPNVLMPVERGGQAKTTLQEAFAAYEAGQYAEAIRLFGEADTASLDLDFYRANALRAQGNTEAALEAFTTIADSDSQFAQQAEWYMAILLWETGKQDSAEEIIGSIAEDEDHEMWKRATRWVE